jgi:hypothetical protein
MGSRHFHSQQVALRVNQDVALASVDFFFPCLRPFQDREPHWF